MHKNEYTVYVIQTHYTYMIRIIFYKNKDFSAKVFAFETKQMILTRQYSSYKRVK